MSHRVLRQRLLTGVAGAALVVVLGSNAPVQAQSAPMWTGFYVGLNAGGAWGAAKASTSVACNMPPISAYMCDNAGGGAANAAAVGASGTGTMTDTGFIGGFQAGYNHQWQSAVLGIETDFDALNLSGSRQANGTYPVGADGVAAGQAYSVGHSFDTKWLWTLRGRAGWLVQPNLLAYLTGGVAATKFNAAFNFSDANGAALSSRMSSTKAGWVLGGGIEWAINDRWTVKGEYLYVDFGSVSASGTVGTTTFGTAYSAGINTSIDLTAQIARIGVNYRF